ncbi:MAG: Rab family GTPase [Gemmatimonadota bacterium]
MSELQKKVCMLGAPGVGKTSLVRRFVESIFSDKYLSTIGAKVDRKVVSVGGRELSFMLWDLQGEEEYEWIRMQYLRGAAGYLLVADGTRKSTLEIALGLQQNAEGRAGQIPFVLIVNKDDLKSTWEVQPEDLKPLQFAGWTVIETSAKSGGGVNEAFQLLAVRLLAEHDATGSGELDME